jgi:propionyl-CoA synthetase
LAEVAVVGVADQLKGQVAMAFAVVKDAGLVPDEAARLQLEGEIMALVDKDLGAIARPARVRFVTVLPKTRSGKLLRRAVQAVCEGRDPGDLTTMDDPAALQQIKDLVRWVRPEFAGSKIRCFLVALSPAAICWHNRPGY